MTPNRPDAGIARADHATAVILAAAALLLMAIHAYFWLRLYGDYLPIRDDPANIGATIQGAPAGWFRHGMAGYYHVYPEWPQPAFSNFYRPVWNLVIFVEQAVLGHHYWAWFLVYCALQFAGALLFLRVLGLLGTPAKPALLFALLFLFNPAFLNSGFIYPGFQFDVFTSLLLLAAFHQLLRFHHGSALALISLAVFTKETAVFAPLAASVTSYILTRNAKWSAAMLVPLIAWAAARQLAFGAVIGGTFASPANIGDLLANIGQGLIVWPTGAVPANFPLSLDGAASALLPAFLLLNAAMWVILAYASVRTCQALRNGEGQGRLEAVALVWAAGALCVCLLIRPQVRFGASLYMFLLLFLAGFLFAGCRAGWLRLLAVMILSLVTGIRGGNFLWHGLANVAQDRRTERALFDGLRGLPQDGSTVLVANAPTMLSAPVFIAKTWDIKRDVIFLNQFRGCAHAGQADARYRLSVHSLSVEIPSCASYVFAGVPVPIQSQAWRDGLSRPGLGHYGFAGLRADGKVLSSGDVDFGRALQIQFTRAPATVLAYDWQSGAYRILEPSRAIVIRD